MTEPRFGRVVTAMVTPFDETGSVDLDAARDLARYLSEHGSDALVVAGSTGEGSSLSDEEKIDLFTTVASSVTIPVLAGSTFASTQQSVTLTRRATTTGVSGILVTTPAYSRPSQAGLVAHFGAVAESTNLPVMIYDIPSRTGRKIESTTIAQVLTAHANVVALKDASGDVVNAARVAAAWNRRLDLYCGDDSLTLAFLAIGAVGVVSVAAHWCGPEFARLVALTLEGQWDDARRLNARLAESCLFESSTDFPNPVPTKAMMRHLGLRVGQCRLPHALGDATLDAEAQRVLSNLRASRD